MSRHQSASRENVADSRPLSAGPYRGEIHSDFDDPALIQAISLPEQLLDAPGAQILLDKRNRIGVVSLPFSSGRVKQIVVKEFSSRGVVRLKSAFLPPKAIRAWRGALALEQRGLATARPVAYLIKREAGFVDRSFLLTEKLEDVEEIRHLFRRLSPSELAPLLASLAGYLSLSHSRGILHRDLSDGNVLVSKDKDGKPLFYLLDTNRIRVRKKIGRMRRLKSLIRLGVPAHLQRDFLRQYSGGQVLPGSSWLWYKMNKGVYTGYVELKKKLRLRELSRKLRIQ